MRPTTTFRLAITIPGGELVTHHETHADAEAELASYVREWWSTEMGTEPMPADPKLAAIRYFERMGDREGAQIKEVPIRRAGASRP